MHERRDPTAPVTSTTELLQRTPNFTNKANTIKLVVDLFFYDRKLVEMEANDISMKALVSLISAHAER